jgi:hypothetical protein
MPTDNPITITVRVTPRAAKTEIVGLADGVLHVRLTAPPVDDAANAACCALIAGALRVPKSNVTVIRGRKSREKVLRVTGSAGPLPWAAD